MDSATSRSTTRRVVGLGNSMIFDDRSELAGRWQEDVLSGYGRSSSTSVRAWDCGEDNFRLSDRNYSPHRWRSRLQSMPHFAIPLHLASELKPYCVCVPARWRLILRIRWKIIVPNHPYLISELLE